MTQLQQIALQTIDGKPASLGDYAGKVLLVVNTASKCGLTPQYEGLTQLYSKFRDRGLVVLGFPSNDFAGQEPGSNEDIANFCAINYAVDFPLFCKVKVVGPQKHPLYASLIAEQPAALGSGSFREKLKGYNVDPNPEPEVLWNFEKFLVGRDGRAVARFAPDLAPADSTVTAAIERELART
jgi:glutathione peroxidase